MTSSADDRLGTKDNYLCVCVGVCLWVGGWLGGRMDGWKDGWMGIDRLIEG